MTRAEHVDGGRHTPFWMAGLLAALAAAAFANSLDNVFALDDAYRIVENPGIRSVQPWWRHFVDVRTMATLPTLLNYRPLLPLTLSLNYAVGELDPWGYHLVNVLLHVVATLVTFGCVRRLLQPRASTAANDVTPLAGAVAAVFAVHPVSGIAVNYVSARDLLLMQVFLTASLWSYASMRARGVSAWRWSVTILLFALALASKMGAAVMPGLILAYDVLLLGSSLRDVRTWGRVLPFVAVVAGVVAFTALVLGHSDASVARNTTVAPLEYGLTQLALHLWHYGRNFVWPAGIRQAPAVVMHPGVDVWVATGALVVAASLWLAWHQRRTRPMVTFGIVAYWVLSIPESTVFPLWAAATDYRPYAGSPFLYAAAIVLLAAHIGRNARIGLLAVSLAYLFAMTREQNATWRSERALWEHSVRHGGSALAYLNLAMTYPEPEPRERLLRESLRLAPEFTVARIDLGLALMDQGKEAEGIAECESAVARDPGRAQGHAWLAVAYERAKRWHDGLRSAEAAVRLEPGNHEYRYRAARLAQAAGKHGDALTHTAPLVRARPPYKDAWFLEAWARHNTGDSPGAEAAYREQLATRPGHVQAHFNLGYLLMERAAYADAVAEFERVLELQPSYLEAHLHLSNCLEKLGRAQEAEPHRRQWESRPTRS